MKNKRVLAAYNKTSNKERDKNGEEQDKITKNS